MQGLERKSKRNLWLIIGVLLLILLTAGVLVYPKARQRWSAPLGEALELPTYTPTIPAPTATQTIEASPTTASN